MTIDYVERYEQHGDDPQTVAMGYWDRQAVRFKVLTGIGDMHDASVLDVGCGLGHMYEWMESVGWFVKYTGIDVVDGFVDVAGKKYLHATFGKWDIVKAPHPIPSEWVFANHVFNDRGWELDIVKTAVLNMYASCTKGMAFTFMSTYVDWEDKDPKYWSPEFWFTWCKEHVSPLVTLRHDYQTQPGVTPYEACLYVYRSDLCPRTTYQAR